MQNEKKKDKVLTIKAKAFLKENKKIHISTILDKFYNGYITEVKKDRLVINEDYFGICDVHFIEIADIKPFIERGVSNGWRK